MASKMSFLDYLISSVGEYMDVPLSETKGHKKTKRNVKKENKFVTQHIRTQNQNMVLRANGTDVRYHV